MDSKYIDAEMIKIGYIPIAEVCRRYGKSQSGHNAERFHKLGIARIDYPCRGDSGKTLYYFKETDVERLMSVAKESIVPVCGESNGGKILSKIKKLEERIEILEKFMREF